MKIHDLLGGTVRNAAPDQLAGSVKEALSYEADTFMVYLGPPQSSYRRSVSDLHVPEMKSLMAEAGLSLEDVVVHAPYIVNLAQADEEKRHYAVDFISAEAERAIAAGFTRMVVHPGAYLGAPVEEGLARIAQSLIEAIAPLDMHAFKILIETMAGKGTEACHTFEEVRSLLDQLPEDCFGVCFDTCHTWDAGYDTKADYEGVLAHFDDVIGLARIGCLHLNDSKNVCGARKDRHANIGFGEIGFATLHRFYKDPLFANVPKILETPYIKKGTTDALPPYRAEIAMLRNGVFDPQILA